MSTQQDRPQNKGVGVKLLISILVPILLALGIKIYSNNILSIGLNPFTTNISSNIYRFSVNDASKKIIPMSTFKGKVILIVNGASECGLTNQYEGLQKLYSELRDKGLEVVVFPSNQFDQELDNVEEIVDFIKTTYKATFPIMDKVQLNGDSAHPIYQHLTSSKAGVLGMKKIQWNFEKFLIDRNGVVRERFNSLTKPEDIRESIIKLLNE